MREVPLSEFIGDYEEGLITNVVTLEIHGEKRVYGKTVKGQSENPRRYEVVYAVLP